MQTRLESIVEKNHWLKLVPNSLTLCNSLCGFGAILYTLRIYERGADHLAVYAISAYVILFAMVFDALDGFVARIFNATSMYGLQMDSLADMVTFGVAPATIVAIMTHSLRRTLTGNQELIIYLLCSIYVGCAALRLAKYNVHAILEHKSSEKFSGLPSPGAAAAVCSVVLFARDCQWNLKYLAFSLPIYAAFLGLLMVSEIPYTHAGKWLFSIRKNRKRFFAFLLMVAFILFFRTVGVVILVTLYVFSGPFQLACEAIFRKKAPEAK